MRNLGENLSALAIAVGLHLAILAVLVVGVQTRRPSVRISTTVIQATVVDGDFIDAEIERLDLDIPEEPEPVVDEREAQRELELERQAERERLQAEEQARQDAEAETRRVEQKRLEEEREQERLTAEAEEARRVAAEEEAQAREEDEEAARLKAEEDAKREAEAEAERKALATRERREAEQQRRREQAQADLNALLAEEERREEAVAAGLEAQYKLKIQQKIERYWRPPPYAPGTRCEAIVRQFRTGDLAAIESVDCGGDAKLARSLEAAINQASPFPRPDEPSLFEPTMIIKFDPDG